MSSGNKLGSVITSDEVLVRVEGVSKKFCRSLKKSLWYGLCDIGAELNPMSRKAEKLKLENSESGSLSASQNVSICPEAVSPSLGSDFSPAAARDEDLRDGEFYAVRDVSFELRRRECLGLIGHNGAGKTTLLKMLNGLIKPDSGKITMRGRVGALIALGAGFNPILTGRENIYINGSVLGLSKREIDEKIDEIIDFAEIGEFIDTPVQNYSSGMNVRLGFAVAASLDPDVLIIDEVLAVGDLGFQAKCFNLLNHKLKNSAVIFVSHAMPQVARVSSKVMFMAHGRSACYTQDVGQGIERYHDSFQNEEATVTGSGGAVLEGVTINGVESLHRKSLESRVRYFETLDVGLRYRLNPKVRECSISLCIYDKSLKMVAMVISRAQNVFFANAGKTNSVSLTLKDLPLAPGTYSVTINFTDVPSDKQGWGELLARYGAAASFTVTGDSNLALSHAPVILRGLWA